MKTKDLLQLYSSDPLVQVLGIELAQGNQHIFLKGLKGSLDAVVAATQIHKKPTSSIFILHDREEAAYFQNDLENLLEQEVLFFPTSYKKPYQFDEIENANVLTRTEVLNKLHDVNSKNLLIVTYPEALTEKVINKRWLVENSLVAKVGDKLDLAFIAEILDSYGFEKNDFVYEAGQYSIRGGIVDIFSFSNQFPYRLEFFGDEIESIRTFNPDNQLSISHIDHISILPNIQQREMVETRESFFSFLKKGTIVWAKDIAHTEEVIDKYYQRACDTRIKTPSPVLFDPEVIFETAKTFLTNILDMQIVEFGRVSYFNDSKAILFNSSSQPSFNKDFKLLSECLEKFQDKGYTNFIAADAPKQFDRLQLIFDEMSHGLNIKFLNIALREGFSDENLKITCFTDHQVFDRFHRVRGRENFSKSKALTLKELKNLHPGDYVTHSDHGVGRFAGLEKIENNGKLQEAIRIVFKDNDLLYVSIHSLHKISKYAGKEGEAPPITKLGSGEWEQKKKTAKRKVKDIAKGLIELYAKRKAAKGYAFSRDTFMQLELETSFIYEDTPDQAKATRDVKDDMEKLTPMDRLVCGDVGFGKTEIAIRAAFKAVCDGKQVAVLVPTTILAFQHFKTFRERLHNLPCRIEYVSRFRTAQQTRDILKQTEEGKVDILIGTHKLVGKEVKFKDLGLLIIDEEQKFGVTIKEKLKEIKVNVDTLTLTATPIPRTMQFSLMGARDFSIIATPPPNRQPVTTEVNVFSETLIRDAVKHEIERGGQVFVVNNKINDLETLGDTIFRMVPDARIAVAHGQMDGDKLEEVMLKFIDGEYDVLVSTNIIESGLDIPNANTIIINKAHMFGLSDLHQMRGRVGRSNKKAYCYLLTPPVSGLSGDARKRLNTLEEFSELGDGFKVAMRDLDIRGAGNILGGEQSGFITDLGFDMYHKILDEAIQELKETDYKDLFSDSNDYTKLLHRDCIIETDLSIVIPDKYVSNISERLSIYTELDNLKTNEELEKFISTLQDRFGNMPQEVLDLADSVRLRWKAIALGIEKLILKNNVMKCYINIPGNDAYFNSDEFGRILNYIKVNNKTTSLKEVKSNLILTVENVKNITSAQKVLNTVTEVEVTA